MPSLTTTRRGEGLEGSSFNAEDAEDAGGAGGAEKVGACLQAMGCALDGASWKKSPASRFLQNAAHTVSKSFSESIHGLRARELAIQARQEMLNLVEDTNTLTRSPGAIAEANPAEFPAAPPRLPAPLLSV